MISWIITIVILIVYDFSASYKENTPDYLIVYYEKPYCWIGAYLVGLLSALYLYSFKNETPEESYFKRAADKLDKSKLIWWSFYVIGMFIMVFLVFSFYHINNYPEEYSLGFNVIYLTFSR